VRLPWPFGRGTTSDPSASALPSPAGGVTPPPPAHGDAPPTGAWASLPPIQRTVGAAPLVAPPAPFLDAVPGRRPLPPIVEPLGHELAPSAPAGLVAARVVPTPSLTSNHAMPTRHVQRRAADAGPAQLAVEDEVPGLAASPAPGPLAAVAASPVEAAVADIATVRQVREVAPSDVVTPAERPLTVAPPVAAASRPAVQRSPAATASASSGSAGAAPTPRVLPLPSRRTPEVRATRWSEAPSAPRPGLGAPIAAEPGPMPSAAVQRSATPGGTGGAGPAGPGVVPAAASVPRDTPAAPPRRAGLGAPLPSLPATAVERPAGPGGLPLAQRSLNAEALARAMLAQGSGPGSAPGASAGAQTGSTDTGAPNLVAARGADDDAQGHDADPGVADAPPARPLPVLPVARVQATAATAAPVAPVAPVIGPSPSPRASDPAAAARRAPVILPLVASRPLQRSVAVQRDADGDATQRDDAATPVAVPARWSLAADLPVTVHELPVTEPALHVMPLAGRSATESAPAPVTVGSRSGRGGSPVSSTPPVQRLAQPAVHPVSPGSPSSVSAHQAWAHPESVSPETVPSPALGLAHGRAGGSQAATAATGPGAVAIQRIEAGPVPATSATAHASPVPALPPFTATPVVQRIDGAAPAAESTPDEQSDSELDDLARKLFGRLRGQLRAEIISEREARGLNFDAF
jgi:hypothetical protein